MQNQNLVAFAIKGEDPKLVTASRGGDTVNVWSLPSLEDEFITKPSSCFSIDGSIER